MIFLSIFLLGFALLSLLSRDFKITERLALAMPIGLGITSFLMFFLDRLTHSITAGSVLVAVLLCVVVFGGLRLFLDFRANDLPWKRPRTKPDMSWLTLVWVVFAGMTAYLVYGISTKCLYWPPAEFDTIEGYDLLSKAIAREHIIANSILTNKEIVTGCGPRLLYPPLLTLCNSLCYMTGMESPKLITVLFYVSWVFIIYLLLRRFVNSTNAILFTLLTVIIPEMFAHASFSLTNLPCAIYSTVAVVSFIIWYEQKKEGFFYLSFIAMILSMWTRSEVVLFVGGILLVLAYIAITEKRFKYLFIYAASVLPFLMWNMFLKAYVPRAQTEFFIKKLFWDPTKLNTVLKTAWEIMSNSNYYALTFYILIAGLFLNAIVNCAVNIKGNNKFIAIALGVLILGWLAFGFNVYLLVLFSITFLVSSYINQEHWAFLLIFLVAFGAYTALFYQMGDTDGSLFSPGGWMQSGYKRGLFCYAPLALFYVATCKWVSWALDKVHTQLVFTDSTK